MAFDKLKKVLTEAPILAYPDFSLPFILATDASDDALGMVLARSSRCVKSSSPTEEGS